MATSSMQGRTRALAIPIIVTLFLPLLAWTALVAGASISGDPASETEVDRFFQAQLDDAVVPGGAVVVVRGEEVVHARGFGSADSAGTAVTERTPFVLGSVSKSFTAMAVMQLWDEGLLRLDDPVQRHLPWFALADDASAQEVTVEMLLTHTSGIPTAAGITPLRGPVLSIEDQVRGLSLATSADPPAGYAYSNANYQVLGSLIEKVSGMTYERYISQHIFEPLAMRSSFTSLPEATAAGLSDGHRLFFGMSRPGRPFYRADFLPAGWLVSSAEDLGHYLVAQMNEGDYEGTELVSPEALAEIHRRRVAVPGPGSTQYGFGWFSGTRNGLNAVWHSGSNGSDMQTMLILLPDHDLAVGVLFNATGTLYEFFQKLDSIAWGVAAIAAGEEPPGTLQMMYPAFIAGVALVTALQIRRAVLVARRRPGRSWAAGILRRQSPRTQKWARRATAALTTFSGVSLLVALPALTVAPWTILVQTDLGLWIGVAALLQMLIGALMVRNVMPGRQAVPLRTTPAMAGASSVTGPKEPARPVG